MLPLATTKPIPETEKAWAAGFFDGEGTTFAYTHTKQYPTLRLHVNQNDPAVLFRFVRAVGVYPKTPVYGPYKTKTNPRWVVQLIKYRDAIKALYEMWPYLDSIKKAQAIRSIERCQEPRISVPRKGALPKTHCNRGHKFTILNTYTTPDGRRNCRACRSAAVIRYQTRIKEN